MPRANEEKGEREIRAGDETYVVKFTPMRIIQMEQQLELSTQEIQQQMQLMSLNHISQVLLHGLRANHRKEFSQIRDLEPLLEGIENLQDLLNPLMEAYIAAYPGLKGMQDDLDDLDDPEPEPAAPAPISRGKKGAPKAALTDDEETG
jgi:hypothetical protein